jgi:hypothetical protein
LVIKDIETTITACRGRKTVFKRTGPWEEVFDEFMKWLFKQKTEDLKETEVEEKPTGRGE